MYSVHYYSITLYMIWEFYDFIWILGMNFYNIHAPVHEIIVLIIYT